MIEVEGLRKRYGAFTAVDGISFDVRHGEVFALLGTNGAGKTTTIEILEGYLRATEGTVRVFGHDPAERGALRSRMGVVLQESGLYGELSAAETVTAWRRFTSDARPVAEALEMVGLTGQAGTRVKRMSGGERRKLDIALATLGRPDLLFLDEPTTGLDAEARRRVRDLVRELSAQGMTVVLTTHYLEEAQELAARVAIMDKGRIVTQGTMAEVLGRGSGRVAFELPAGAGPEGLPVGGDDTLTVTGRRCVIVTAEPEAVAHAVLGWAHTKGLRLSGLDVRQATLEEVFLDIADRGAREVRT
ncbi:multidrug ABC transporter ATP-binding protein [Sphaerisporangium melleum]|uniref:Multidrug ABC transporter ATP-binding protein n=1 Tax=Sphaerisporangium melleum TaxID=321316 RepID=A0A917RA35_9ACTN|nr:multidrug ABC transporter ATP-binding protein [Sphaerisporangium melleum]GII73668.1 multidrug ABC transporter ATP-binding protein [Sphaerisporangium melleum]